MTPNLVSNGPVLIKAGLGNYASAATTTPATITTTGTVDAYILAPCTGKLTAASLTSTDGLTRDATNYITFSIANMSNSTAAMLAVSDANTTKTTTGTAVTALTARSFTLNGTAANLNVTKGDQIRCRALNNGTAANTLTFSIYQLSFDPVTS